MWFESDSDAIRRKLGILIRCHERILPHLRSINGLASTIQERREYKHSEYAPRIKEAKVHLEKEVRTLKDLFERERALNSAVEAVDRELYSQLLSDMEMMERAVGCMETLLTGLDDVLDNYHRFQESGVVFSELLELQERIESLEKRECYQERMLARILDATREVWEERLHGNFAWLYHATSVLFLPSVQQHGLDSSKLPESIAKALGNISQALRNAQERGGIKKQGGMGFDIRGLGELTERGTFFSWRPDDIRHSAAAASLPAFLYELFDEQAAEEALPGIKKHLTPEERHICDVIWRFGKYLRAKNKVVMLRVKADSAFLKHLSLPDYLGDYDAFITHYVKRFVPLFVSAEPQAVALHVACPPQHEIFTRLYEGSYGWDREFYLKEPVPARFVYVDVASPAGPVPLEIEKWALGITPAFL